MQSVDLIKKIQSGSLQLEDLCETKAGMKVRKEFVAERQIDKRFQPFLLGTDVKSFSVAWRGKWVCYDKSLESAFTNQAFREEQIFRTDEKILVRQVMGKSRIIATIDRNRFYADQTLYVLLPKSADVPLSFVLALLSSRLMGFFFGATMADRKETFPKIKGSQIKQLPIRVPNAHSPSLVALVSEIDARAEHILALYQREGGAKTAHDKTFIERQIEQTDRQIDRLVYELYELTEEEIAIVEGAA